MPQMQLPIFPSELTFITEELGFQQWDGVFIAKEIQKALKKRKGHILTEDASRSTFLILS